ncbi:ribbon-helix-helix protein, CopG family [Silanimonas sp.]|jgi:predicted transcriptional regulator|uniref:CopG family ribbon-helix-helix protein n=1 Tax=Silanimonas sp. TaxID=1929290 RepID=UPI0022C382EF|nr:ribbon-helix-helix protein, CopG family [Silanimonas sp.]MCZ8061833.1 ribbon-helix-helix protein, CopG family [Silanimonas sp.]
MTVTSVRLQPDVETGLAAISEKLQRSRNWVINEAVREYVAKRAADDALWADTLEAIEDVAAGRVVDGEAVHRWMRSWGTADELPAPKPGP